ncbi:HAD-superfamily hydrolase, subfamily IA, variant 1 [Methylobacterium sp. 4-46]|uniref:HAD hydrolase-like protein n=1 Tax=unclassified Methylobacterium TaxID=2615210 RepID=UPI000152DE7C|nr:MULTISPECIES: HAD hydrolase-like protein [Methylobacterium]ACA20139.1 HAD-superfamily hydrolase, subfamily IA, variant 1 [Methylobacterium sp. 4-46]WFT79319.1 HAD hydrolase-like protein [Methylobacterium nodulans]
MTRRGAGPPPAGPYGLVLLDFDGTLADSFPWFCRVLDGVADRYGFRRVAPGEVEDLRRLGARAILHRLEVPAWKLPLIARHMRALAARDAEEIGLFPGIPGLLARLAAAGLRLAVVTANREATVRRVLGPESAARIDAFACGAPLFGKARRFRALVRAGGLPPERVICLGDELRDAEAAAACGLAFGAVAWGYTRPDALAALRPAHLFATPEAVAETLAPRRAAA